MLRPERRSLVRGLIYPVPDPEFPFLGVHLTRTVHGDVEAGPNALLPFAREGHPFAPVSPPGVAPALPYPGFLAVAAPHQRRRDLPMDRSLGRAALPPGRGPPR